MKNLHESMDKWWDMVYNMWQYPLLEIFFRIVQVSATGAVYEDAL